MEIKAEFKDVFRRHLQYVIRDHISANSDHYAEVALQQIERQALELDDVTIRVEIRFNGICERFRLYQAGEVDRI